MRKPLVSTAILGALLLGASTVFAASIAGIVADSSGRPLSGVTVSAANSAGSSAGSAISDSSGHYALEGLTPGTYTLNSSGQSAVSYVGSKGLTVNWGVAHNAPAIATAHAGVSAGHSESNPLTPIASTADKREGPPPGCKGMDGPPCGPKSPKK